MKKRPIIYPSLLTIILSICLLSGLTSCFDGSSIPQLVITKKNRREDDHNKDNHDYDHNHDHDHDDQPNESEVGIITVDKPVVDNKVLSEKPEEKVASKIPWKAYTPSDETILRDIGHAIGKAALKGDIGTIEKKLSDFIEPKKDGFISIEDFKIILGQAANDVIRLKYKDGLKKRKAALKILTCSFYTRKRDDLFKPHKNNQILHKVFLNVISQHEEDRLGAEKWEKAKIEESYCLIQEAIRNTTILKGSITKKLFRDMTGEGQKWELYQKLVKTKETKAGSAAGGGVKAKTS